MSGAEHPFPWSEDAICRPSAENDAPRRFGTGRLKDPSFAVSVQADRCGFFASIVLGRRIFWCDIPPANGGAA